jgi:hypothetical protein
MLTRQIPTTIRSLVLLAALVLATLAVLSSSASASHSPALVQLNSGGNLVSYEGATLPVRTALGDAAIDIEAVFAFDSVTQSWALWAPALPDTLQGIDELTHGSAYFIFAARTSIWSFLDSEPAALTTCAEQLTTAGAVETTADVFFLIEPVEFAGGEPLLCSVERSVPSESPARGAVDDLLDGPSLGEAISGISSRWDGTITGPTAGSFSIDIVAGTATIQFVVQVILTGVVADAIMQRQLERTLTQFPTIDEVIILNQFGDCMFDQSGLNLCLS